MACNLQSLVCIIQMNCDINIILIQTKWIFALMSEILQVEPLFIPKLMTHIFGDGGQGLWYVSADHKVHSRFHFSRSGITGMYH